MENIGLDMSKGEVEVNAENIKNVHKYFLRKNLKGQKKETCVSSETLKTISLVSPESSDSPVSSESPISPELSDSPVSPDSPNPPESPDQLRS